MLFMAVRGCQEGPFGRHQIVGLSPQQESQLGAQAFQQVLQKSDVVYSGPAVAAVRQVGERLATATQSPDFLRAVRLQPARLDWEFRVVRSSQVNAFCLPGGKVVVYTGILPVCQTEAGLATVMGHEIGHALAHHGAERIAQQQIASIGEQGVAVSLGGSDPATRQQVMAALGMGAQVGFLLPFSRKHESEADHIGLLLMATAGYDPREAVRFWVRMEEQASSDRAPPPFLSTHPGHEQRAGDLQRWMPEALQLYNVSPQYRDRPLPIVGDERRRGYSFSPGP
jgi:metalloendopeptidase OMA1, mitochondrial